MFLVLTIIGLIIVGIGGIVYKKDYDASFGYFMIGTIMSTICGITLIILIGVYSFNKPTINNKIEMYEEENKNVETQLVDSVNMWLTHQETTFESISNIDGVTTYLVKYPDLKGDSLVDELMETYKNNSKEIKQLKSRKINLEGIAKIGWLGK